MRRDRVLLSTALLALSPLTGCDRQPAATAQSAAAPAGSPIQVVRPEMRAVARVVEQPGAVRAFEETALLAKIPGYVSAIADDPAKASRPPHDRRIDIGSRVKRDQVLAELAIPELDAERQRKQALIRQAEAEVVQSDKSLLAARAAVAAAGEAVTEAEAGVARAQALYDRWHSEANRITKLVKGGVIDDQSRDEIQNQFRAAGATRSEATAHVAAARAAVKKAEADRDKAAADVVAAKARQEVARAAVAEVDARRGYAKIRAPFDGVVTHRAVNTGDLVSPAEKRPLFRVARIDPVRVVVRVPEADAGLVADGQAVLVALQAVPGPAVRGTVTRSSWSLEPGSRTLRTEVDLPNPDGRFRPGMYVAAKLTAELPAAWAVPAAAVGKVGDEPVMYLAENGKAVRVVVQPLRGDAKFTQIRGYKKPGATDWTAITGNEPIITPAAAVTDGQPAGV